MKSIIVKAVMITCLFAPLTAFAQGPKGNDLLRMCLNFVVVEALPNRATASDEQAVQGMMCLTYLTGIRETAGLFNKRAELDGRSPSFFCIPNNIQMGEVARAMGYSLQGLQRNNPKALDDDAFSVASRMLGVLFPCETT